MTQLCPSPITQDNFAEIWRHTDAVRRRVKKKYIISKIAPFFSHMMFMVLTFISGNCLIYDHMSGSYCDFLDSIPYLLPAWEKYSPLFLKPSQSPGFQILLTALVIYGISFAVCGLFALLIRAVYHPLKKQLPTGSVKENAEALLAMARDARRYANRSGTGISVFWSFVFTAAVLGTVAIYWLTTLNDMEAIVEIVTGFFMSLLEPYLTSDLMYSTAQSAILAPCLMLSCLGIYLGYTVLSSLHTLSIQFLYKSTVPYSFVAQVECYSIFAEQNVSGFSPEEIAQLQRDQAADKRVQALDLERIGAHGKARQLLAEAAHGGDVEAMEHYARHWLITNGKDPARYWLERCVESGQAGEEAVKMLKKLKWHRRIQVRYLKETA